MSDTKPWTPTLDNAKDFSDLANRAHGNIPPDREPPLRVPPRATEDTAPLRGSKDVSDPDSLEDVIAESYEPDAPTQPPQASPQSKR
jgi:hypothetical protein